MDHHSDKHRPLDWIIGVRVRVKTSFGEEIEGEVYTYDNITNCVVLQDSSVASKKSFRILKTSFIKELYALQSSPSSVIPLDDLPPVNIVRIRNREEAALSSMRQKLGIGVTAEAQEIFNALSKTLPCRWDNKEIVVFDDIRISSPYRLENCTGGTQASLERVQKVLEGEKRRLMKQNPKQKSGKPL